MEELEEKLGVTMSDSGTIPRGGKTHCDPCENEGRYSQAEGFCTNCDDYLCTGCLKIHRRPVLWRYHELLGKQNMPKMKLIKGMVYDCTEPCAQHPKEILEYFCRTHDKLACSLCFFRNHRYCYNVDYIPDVANLISESEELEAVIDNFACVMKDIEVRKRLIEESLAEVDEIQEKAVTKITMLRFEICDFFDKLLEDITFISRSDSTNLKACSNSLKKVAKRVKTSLTILEKKRKERKMSQLFVDMKLSQLALNDMIKEVERTKAQCKVQQYEVDIEDSIVSEIRKCLERVWKIKVLDKYPVSEEEGGFQSKNLDNIEDVKKSSPEESLAEHGDETAKWQNKEEDKVEITAKMLEHNKTLFAAECNPPDTKTKLAREIKDPSGVRQYDREFLLKMQTSFHALRKPEGILDVPEIVFDEPQDLYLRWMKAQTVAKQQDLYSFRPNYVLGEWNAKVKKKALYKEQETVDSKLSVMHLTSKQNGEDVKKATTTATQAANEKPQDNSHLPCKIKQKLYALIVKEEQDDQNIIDWIESNVDESQKSATTFVNVLMDNVCRFSCEKDDNGGWLFHPEKIVDRKDLLLKYIDSNFDHELEALYAVQIFVEKYKHPSGLLREAFGVLYNVGIISEVTFLKLKEGNETKTSEDCSKPAPSMKQIKQMLHGLIIREMQDDKNIIDWIESNVEGSRKLGTPFVKLLMNNVCRFSSDKDDQGNWLFYPEKIREKKDLLLKYIDRKIDHELEALFVVQNFIEKLEHPPCILRKTFDVLYDADIISEDAFFKWETSEEKPIIREECLRQTVPFFTWLLTKGRTN